MSITETEPFFKINVMAPEALSDPQAYLAELREYEPVFWDARYRSWVVTSYRHATAALRDERFSSDRIEPYIRKKLSGPDTDPLVLHAFEVLSGWLVFKEEPAHMRLRGLCSQAFTPPSIAQLRSRVESLCAELLADIPDVGEFDLVQKVATPVPSIIMAEMMGVPVEDRVNFEHWTAQVAPLVSTALDDPTRHEGITQGMGSLVTYFRGLIEHYRKAPEDNLISALISARDDDDILSEAELIATCTLFLFGGHETTANFIANSVLALLRHPDQLALLRDDKVDMKNALEELLRFDGPAKTVVRLAREDFDFGGRQIKQGQRVFVMLSVANRDPKAFEDPNDLRLDRGSVRHIGFGFGGHFCLGAPLARLEAGIAIPQIVKRFPELRLAPKALKWRVLLGVRGLRELYLIAG